MAKKPEAKQFTEWRGPFLARLRSHRDLNLTICGKPYLVTAVPHTDQNGPCTKIEFWRESKPNPKTGLADQCFWTEGVRHIRECPTFTFTDRMKYSYIQNGLTVIEAHNA